MRRTTMKKTTMIALLSIGSLLLVAGTGFAGGGWGQRGGFGDGAGQHRFMGRGGGMLRGDPARLKERLGLSDTQVQQLKAIRDGLAAKTAAQRQKLVPLRQKMHALMQADVIDAGAIYAVHTQLRALQQVLGDEGFRARIQLLQVLSKEQRGKMQLHRGGRGMRFGNPGAAATGSES